VTLGQGLDLLKSFIVKATRATVWVPPYVNELNTTDSILRTVIG
jgi:hypothetical protein